MARGVPTQVATEIAADESRPIILLEMTLDLGTLRYAQSVDNILFPTSGGYIYTARTFHIANITLSAEGTISTASLQFDDVTSEISTYADAESFEKKAIVVKRVYQNQMTNALYYNEMFSGHMGVVDPIGQQWAQIPMISGTPLSEHLLLNVYQPRCNRIFGDTGCNKDTFSDLSALTASGAVASGSTTTLVDSNLTQAEGYWNYGRIEITYDGNVYRRKIKSFTAATDALTFDVALPFSVSAGVSYVVYKGCDGRWETCEGGSATTPGPSDDNKANFLGFLHIGKEE